ncbi:hypothetical protein C1646_817568 [Rhizophagus diaphanus]|nr:hypothetical protein C1646_817568 [Rhizophagus diaphanus] [Rhizophagus sp. MUCL 43196]
MPRSKVTPMTKTVNIPRGGKIVVRTEPHMHGTLVAITIGFPFRVNHWILRLLTTGSYILDSKTERIDETILAFAAFQNIKNILHASAGASMRNKSTQLTCGTQEKEFLITAVCVRNGTSTKKCAGILLEGLRFDKFLPSYKNICNNLGIKPSKDAFEFAVYDAIRFVQNKLAVVVTGRVSITKDKFDDFTKNLANKLPEYHVSKVSSSPRTVPLQEGKHTEYSSIHVSGLEGVFLYEYIKGSIPAIALFISDSNLWFPAHMENKVYNLSDKARITRFAQRVMRKFGSMDPLGGYLFEAAVNCWVSTSVLTLKQPSITESTITAKIQKLLWS